MCHVLIAAFDDSCFCPFNVEIEQRLKVHKKRLSLSQNEIKKLVYDKDFKVRYLGTVVVLLC